MRHIGDDERRARIARRHAVAPRTRVDDPVAATRAMTVLHATEPATVYLSLFARVRELAVEDVDRVLYRDRSLVKQLAMRRTLFAFPVDLLSAAWGSASTRVAAQERRRLAKDVVTAGIAPDGEAWVEGACAAVLTYLDTVEACSATELREAVPAIQGRVSVAPDKPYGGNFPVAPRVLGLLGARGQVVRGENVGHWRLSRPTWTLMSRWLGGGPAPCPEEAGYAELVRRWLGTFGPGATADLQWWLGSTVTAVRRALAAVEAVEVSLDGGGTGWLLPDDLDPVTYDEPWAALLPILDPTTMGWKEREFYLGRYRDRIFDTAGNAGTTAWWNGRIVGCWVQDDAGAVRVVLLEDVGADARAALDAEAKRLTDWLGGVRVGTVYPSPLMKEARSAQAG